MMSADHQTKDPLCTVSRQVTQGCILVKDSLESSGYFLLPWLVRASLQDGWKVLVLAAAYSSTRYKAVLKKLGALSSEQAANNIAFISPQVTAHAHESSPSNGTDVLHQLLLQTRDAAAALITSSAHASGNDSMDRVTLVIDSLSHLSCMAPDKASWWAFLHYCRSLGTTLGVPLLVIYLAHEDTPDDQLWVRYLEHVAEVVLVLAPVIGRTAELDGQLTVCTRMSHPSSKPDDQTDHEETGAMQPSIQTFFFRASEYAIRWIPHLTGKELLHG
eukprot:jgi/Chrzof1/10261/Cz04g34190.t1